MFFNHQKALLVRFVLIFTLLGGMFGMSPVRLALADTLIVTNTNDSGPGSLRQEIADAVSGDIITFDFDPPQENPTITLSSELMIAKDLTIDGSGLDEMLVLSGENISRIMQITVNAQVTISDLAFTLGNAVEVGAIYVNGNSRLDVENSRFYQNQASSSGGAISVQGDGSLTVNNTTFSNNFAGNDGGAISNSGSSTISQSTIEENHAGMDGGAISITELGIAYIVNSTVTGNEAASRGGAIYFGHGPANVFNSTFAHNVAANGSEVFIADGLQSSCKACSR